MIADFMCRIKNSKIHFVMKAQLLFWTLNNQISCFKFIVSWIWKHIYVDVDWKQHFLVQFKYQNAHFNEVWQVNGNFWTLNEKNIQTASSIFIWDLFIWLYRDLYFFFIYTIGQVSRHTPRKRNLTFFFFICSYSQF